VGGNCPTLPASIIRNSITYGTLAVGKQSALLESRQNSKLGLLNPEMTEKHVFLVLLNLEVIPLHFSSLKAAYPAASRLSQRYFSRLIAAHIRASPILRHNEARWHVCELLCNSMTSAKNRTGIQPASL
jgi:hypothetical protein